MYEHIKVDTAGPIGRLCFQRPEKKNSMIPEMGDEILRAVEQLNANSQVRSIIVTGAGDVFSSGGDLDMIDELTEVDRADSSEYMLRYYRKYFALNQLQMPTVAMINGHAIGAGLCIALACDLRTISNRAKVGTTFVRVGLNVGMGGTYTLPRIIGLGRAAEMLFTAKLISAQHALEIGLVNRVCAPEQLESETEALARRIAEHAPAALRYTKRSLYVGLSGDLDAVFHSEADGQSCCYQTQDLREGVAAVKQKRKPEFTGK